MDNDADNDDLAITIARLFLRNRQAKNTADVCILVAITSTLEGQSFMCQGHLITKSHHEPQNLIAELKHELKQRQSTEGKKNK